MFCADKRLRVFLDGEYLLPATTERKGDDIAPRPGEGVDENSLGSGCGGDMVCYLSTSHVSEVKCGRGNILTLPRAQE